MNFCKNCKFLGEEIDKWDCDEGKTVMTGFHQCKRIDHDANWDSNNTVHPDSAVVVDGSGYFAALRVKEDFGCIYFEEK